MTLSPWRKKLDGNIGHAIEAKVIAPNEANGYPDEGYRIICTYQGRYDNVAGLSEDAHAEAIGDMIVARVNAYPGLVEALRNLLDRYTELVNCGDCGNWNPEEEDHVIAARAALASLSQVTE